jgi:hypothetical protein
MTDQETSTEPETKLETPQPQKKKRVRGNAIDRLAKATARSVRDRSAELSDALFKRALEGDVNCTKLLVTLIEKLPPPKRKYRSIALQWANSPVWQDPEHNADAGEDIESDEAFLADALALVGDRSENDPSR